MEIIRGKAWVFGDNLDVDFELIGDIQTFSAMRRKGASQEELGKMCLKGVDPDFSKKVTKGDLIIAGENMGCGHDHAHGAEVIKWCGVGAVIAESLGEWFLRNSILVGLPVVAYEGIKQKVNEGEKLELDYPRGKLTNLSTGNIMRFKPLPSFLLKIMESGNLHNHIQELISERKLATYLE